MNLVKIGKACILTCSMLVACASCSDDKPVAEVTDSKPWDYNKDMDVSVMPGDDFFNYAIGGWAKTATLPAKKHIWGTIYEANETQGKRVSELASDQTDPLLSKIYANISDTPESDQKLKVTVLAQLTQSENTKTLQDLSSMSGKIS